MSEIACGASSHVQAEGQSPSDVQVTVFAEQCDVDSVVVVQTGGSGGGTGSPPAEGADAPPEQPTSSGVQANPSPQSDAVVHGRRYLGTHDVVVVDVQAGAGAGSGCGQSPFGGHPGDVWSGQFLIVWEKQTIPAAQSSADLHGSGVHWEIVSGLHTGCVHVSPGAHAIAGHGVAIVVVSHVKPFGQSLLWAHVLDAQTVAGASTAPDARRKARAWRNDRCGIIGGLLRSRR